MTALSNARRRTAGRLASLAALVTLTSLGTRASAQSAGFPTKPVRMVVPYPAGGATDIIARLIAERLTTKWGQTVIVDNRPGAGTTIGAESVARSPADGYTIYMTTSAHTISGSLYKKLGYSPSADFTPITLIATIPLVLVTNATLPARDLGELVAYVRSSGKSLNLASPGNGTAQHLAGELFKNAAKIDAIHVPYKGDAPMINDLLGAQVDAAFVTLSVAIPHIQSGKLKAIALAHSRRIDAVANVPTFAEAGMPGFEAATWFGLLAPAALPEPIVRQIRQDVSDIVVTPSVRKTLIDMGAEINNSTPADFGSFMKAETERWAQAARLSGARLD